MIGRLIEGLTHIALAIIRIVVAVDVLRSGAAAVEASAPATSRSTMRRWALTAAGLVVLAGIGGALIVLSGIVPIKASSGHWAITEWFLELAMRRSIATHTLGIRAPSLDDATLVVKGAGHYHTACRPCHGGPDLAQPRIASRMTPRPPDLRPEIKGISRRSCSTSSSTASSSPECRPGRRSSGTMKCGRWLPSCGSCQRWTRGAITTTSRA